MNKSQEEALIMMFVGAPGIVICGLVGIGLAWLEEVSFLRMLIQLAVFSAVVDLFWAFPFILRRKRKSKSGITFDERDKIIHKKAVLAAYVFLWMYFVITIMILWYKVGPKGSIPIVTLPVVLICGLAFFTLVKSISTLILYGWSSKDGE